MRAREELMKSDVFGEDIKKASIILEGKSDSFNAWLLNC
jgi:glutamate synthase (ferredoxin)